VSLVRVQDIREVTQAGGTNVAKPPDELRKTLPMKISLRLHRGKRGKCTNVEKSLEAVFDKFDQFLNDDFLRYSTVTLIRVLYVLKKGIKINYWQRIGDFSAVYSI